MKRLLLVFIVLTSTSCSFDNKTGLWKDASTISVENNVSKSIDNANPTSRYEDVSVKTKLFNKEVEVASNLVFQLEPPLKINNCQLRLSFEKHNSNAGQYAVTIEENVHIDKYYVVQFPTLVLNRTFKHAW